jgi:hypothetical protein
MNTKLHVVPKYGLALLLIGCGQPLPCPDCNSEDDEAIPDLPCGGADLQTDDFNCGMCGNECVVYRAGTDYEAGNCREGRCGPHWYNKQYPLADAGNLPKASCQDVCAEHSVSCVVQGCSGKTGYMCHIGDDFSPACTPIDWTGLCTAHVPWPDFGGSVIPVLYCCCE